jgi:hypothetical protein
MTMIIVAMIDVCITPQAHSGTHSAKKKFFLRLFYAESRKHLQVKVTVLDKVRFPLAAKRTPI